MSKRSSVSIGVGRRKVTVSERVLPVLAAAAPPDPTPRIGEGGGQRRVYLDHAFDVGTYNPCFPEYTFDHLDDEKAWGRVSFPVVYEGPPGLVNGGFLE